MSKFQRKLLVLASPRSATRFMTRLLRSAQVKIGHEHMKRDGTCGMFFAAEDCWYPGKHWTDDFGTEDESRQRRSDYEFEQVWHMTRDPRKVIPSIASPVLNQNIWCWQERHTGISCGIYPKMLRSMLFWVAWNELIEKTGEAALCFRVEDVDARWPEMCDRLDIPYKPISSKIPRDYGACQETGPRRLVPLNFDDMEAIDLETAKRVREMAERYGYDVKETL